jgi:hypothetical protein
MYILLDVVNYGEPPGSPVSSPIKLTVNDITEILLKVALSTKHPKPE